MPMTEAGKLAPRSPVGPGMSESEAGEAITRYLDGAVARIGDENVDLDVFDGSRESIPVPDEAASESSPEPGESPRQSPASEAPADGDDPDADESSQEEEVTTEDGSEDGAQEDDAQVRLEASQLAAILGVEEDSLVINDEGAVQLRYRVDGNAGEATLQDVLASYQLQGHVNRKSEQVSEERKQLHAETQRLHGELQGAIAQANALQQVMEERVVDRYSRVDWTRLKSENPGQAALLQQEMNTEVQAIRLEADKVRQQVATQAQQVQEQMAQRHQEWLLEEQRSLFHHLPELQDEVKRPDILRGYQQYLTGYGFRPEEIQTIHDHRFLRVIADAVAYATGKKSDPDGPAPKEVLKKRLAVVPKVARGGTPRTEDEQRGDRRNKAAKALRSTGSDDDAARFAVESGIVDSML